MWRSGSGRTCRIRLGCSAWDRDFLWVFGGLWLILSMMINTVAVVRYALASKNSIKYTEAPLKCVIEATYRHSRALTLTLPHG